jgi:membrane protein implicated in regulation of membrane protease activity
VLRSLIAPWVPAVVRHLEGWAEVAGEDLRDAAAHVGRRLVALLVAGAAAFVSFLMLCAWLLILAWDGPWRAWVAGGLALAFAALAAALAWPAFRRRTQPQDVFFTRIRTELGRDRELFERSLDGDGRAAAGRGEDHAAH